MPEFWLSFCVSFFSPLAFQVYLTFRVFIVTTILFLILGEVERLLKEYRQNQELVRNIGAHYYQIIYPVQLRHHEKMGISTREIGTKVREKRMKGVGGGGTVGYEWMKKYDEK